MKSRIELAPATDSAVMLVRGKASGLWVPLGSKRCGESVPHDLRTLILRTSARSDIARRARIPG